MNLSNPSFQVYRCSVCSREVAGLTTMSVWCQPYCPPCALRRGHHPPRPAPVTPPDVRSDRVKRLMGISTPEQRAKWKAKNDARKGLRN